MTLHDEDRVIGRASVGVPPIDPAAGGPPPGEPDETGLSRQHLDVTDKGPAVKADVEERQAVEVRPMRYVLFIGLFGALIGMFVAWLLIR